MSEEILVNVTPMESRVALVQNGVLQEVYLERAASKGIVGNIYKAGYDFNPLWVLPYQTHCH